MSYKIFIIEKGERLFSKGGVNPLFTKIGKSWSTAAALNSHLAQFVGRDYNLPREEREKKENFIIRIPENWFVLNVESGNVYNARDFYFNKKDAKVLEDLSFDKVQNLLLKIAKDLVFSSKEEVIKNILGKKYKL